MNHLKPSPLPADERLKMTEALRCMVYNSTMATLSNSATRTRLSPLQPTPVYEDEILDWDCSFDNPPPPKASGRIEVILRKAEIEPSPI